MIKLSSFITLVTVYHGNTELYAFITEKHDCNGIHIYEMREVLNPTESMAWLDPCMYHNNFWHCIIYLQPQIMTKDNPMGYISFNHELWSRDCVCIHETVTSSTGHSCRKMYALIYMQHEICNSKVVVGWGGGWWVIITVDLHYATISCTGAKQHHIYLSKCYCNSSNVLIWPRISIVEYVYSIQCVPEKLNRVEYLCDYWI